MGYAALKPWTEHDYLHHEATARQRHEFVHGSLYAMAGASERHNTIAGNIFARLHTARRGGPCRPFIGDMKLRLDSGSLYYYPDVMLVCSPQDDAPLVKTAPCLVAEVTSPSTEVTDRREKLAAYLKLASLREYLIVSHTAPRIDVYQRPGPIGEPWQHAVLGGGESVALLCLPLTLAVDEVYADVDFGSQVGEAAN
ncbi:MAG: Uma2 family endonuclease [Pseudomonadota bacterium]|nr:Uma2 family endonuclease [Pseudomonadota bacterium]